MATTASQAKLSLIDQNVKPFSFRQIFNSDRQPCSRGIEDYPVTPWRDCSPASGGIPRKKFLSIYNALAIGDQRAKQAWRCTALT